MGRRMVNWDVEVSECVPLKGNTTGKYEQNQEDRFRRRFYCTHTAVVEDGVLHSDT